MKKVSKILQIQLFPTLLARIFTYDKRVYGCRHHKADEGKANICFCLHGSLLFILEIHNFNVAGSAKDGAPDKDF